MKKLILLIAVVLFYVACQQNNLPKGIIIKEKMINVMLDMQLTDAALNQVYNTDTMKMQAHSRYNYVFNKYKIDSAMFTNSLKHYSKDPIELDSMYTLVSDSLLRIQDDFNPKETKFVNDFATTQEMYTYLFGKFKRHASNLNHVNTYNVDIKKSYIQYTYLDSLKRLQDSIKLKQVEETKKSNKD